MFKKRLDSKSLKLFSDEKLAELIKNKGDQEALYILSKRILPLAYWVVKPYFDNYFYEEDDFNSDCFIALYKAIQKWLPGKGAKFSTFFVSVMKSVCKSSIRQATAKKRFDPDIQILSIDAPISEEDDQASIDIIPDNSQKTEEHYEIKDFITGCLNAQSEELRNIATLYFFHDYTLEEIAKFYDKSISSIGKLIKEFEQYCKEQSNSSIDLLECSQEAKS